MSKFIAERVYRLTDENNDLIVCYVVHGDNKKAALVEMMCDKTDGCCGKKEEIKDSLNMNSRKKRG